MAEDATGAWDEHRPPDPELIADCVHCGFCLPTCPTYVVFGEEMDSPRGRIVLMRVGTRRAREPPAELRMHIDRCLGCMACVTACPSGVQYDQLIERARPQIERNAPRPRRERLLPAADLRALHPPGRLRALAPVLVARAEARASERARRAARPRARAAGDDAARAAGARARGDRPAARGHAGARRARGRVALMQGCVQRVFFGDVNAATVRVLGAEGWEVHAPRRPRCCGSLQMHAGVEEEALELAQGDDRRVRGLRVRRGQRGRLRLGHEGLRAPARRRPRVGRARRGVLGEGRATSASCSPSTSRRRRATRCRCASPTTTPATSPTPRRCASSRARCCARSPELELLEPAEWEICCGSAGIYNLVQPDAAAELGRAQGRATSRATGAEASPPANPGCALQIAAHLDGRDAARSSTR